MTRKHPASHLAGEKKNNEPRIKGKVDILCMDIMHGRKCNFLVMKAGKAQLYQSKHIKIGL